LNIVLTLDDDRISAITRFLDGSVYPHFGLPRTLPLGDSVVDSHDHRR
jgi:hypothetical protein